MQVKSDLDNKFRELLAKNDLNGIIEMVQEITTLARKACATDQSLYVQYTKAGTQIMDSIFASGNLQLILQLTTAWTKNPQFQEDLSCVLICSQIARLENQEIAQQIAQQFMKEVGDVDIRKLNFYSIFFKAIEYGKVELMKFLLDNYDYSIVSAKCYDNPLASPSINYSSNLEAALEYIKREHKSSLIAIPLTLAILDSSKCDATEAQKAEIKNQRWFKALNRIQLEQQAKLLLLVRNRTIDKP